VEQLTAERQALAGGGEEEGRQYSTKFYTVTRGRLKVISHATHFLRIFCTVKVGYNHVISNKWGWINYCSNKSYQEISLNFACFFFFGKKKRLEDDISQPCLSSMVL